MKKMLIIMVVAQLALVLGCVHTSSNNYSAELLAEKTRSEKTAKLLDTSAAPVLGPMQKEFLVALLEDDIDKAWGMVSHAGQTRMTASVRDYKENSSGIRDNLENMRQRLNAMEQTKAPCDEKILLEHRIAMTEALLQANSGQDMLKAMAIKMWFLCRYEMKITSEQVNGDKGFVILKTGLPKPEQRIDFKKEDGVWKLL